LETLSRFGVSVRSIIVNGLVPEGPGDCSFCRARREEQGGHVRDIRRRFPHLRLTSIPWQASEVRGVESLRLFGAEIAPVLGPAV
jgi:anion-transporting  ArsA/GET3 family ATPase